jgi:hypothetical protein
MIGVAAAVMQINHSHNYHSLEKDKCEEANCKNDADNECSICKKEICDEHRLLNKGHHCKNGKFEKV